MFGCRHERGFERFAGGEGRGGRGGPKGDFGGGRGGRGGGDMFRIGRMLAHGDLKLLALALIAQQPRHGYEIIKVVEEKTGGWYSPSPGVVYPTLTYLEEAGYVTAEPDGTKKRYVITEEGRAYLEENRDFADTILARLDELADKMGRVRRWMGWNEGGPRRGGREGGLPRLVGAALENLRDAAEERLQQNAGAEPRIVEILARAANELKDA